MSHHVQPPASTIATENLEKYTCNSVGPNVPRPPSRAIYNVDLRKPGFSDRIEEHKEETKSEKVLHVAKVEENADVVRKSEEKTMHTHVKETFVEETIEVATTTPNINIERNTETGKEESETTLAEIDKKLGKEQTKATETRHEVINVPTHQNIEESQQTSELEDSKASPADASNVIHQSAFSGDCDYNHSSTRVASNLEENNGIMSESSPSDKNEMKGTVLNGSRHKQHALLSGSRTEIRNTKRRHSLSSHSRNTLAESSSLDSKTYVNSRFRLRSTKVSVTGNAVEEGVRNSTSKTTGSAVGTKRRHSAISQSVVNTVEETTCILQEPCVKRRTRSEDRRNPVDENDPVNLKDASSSLSWSAGESNIPRSTGNATTVPIQEKLSSLSTFQRSLGKKATPVKAIRRPSIKGLLKQLWAASLGAREWDQGRNNRSNSCSDRRLNRSLSIIGSTDSTTVPQRWLRYVFFHFCRSVR